MKGCDMHRKTIAAVLAAAGVTLTCATAARAGFVNQAAPAPAPASAVAPVQSGAAPTPEVAQHALNAAPSTTAMPAAPAAPVALPDATGRKVTQIGLRPSNVSVPRGMGNNIALGDVLPAIVPRDFRIDTHAADAQQPISWSGGQPWDTVLNASLANAYGTEATIDWNQKLVSVRRVGMAPVTSSVAMRPAAPQAVAMRWDVRASDVTLRQALLRWAKDAGWQVSWEIAYDYPVQLEGSFAGSFEDAVTQFMSSLRYSDYPALACLYEANHVVRVLHYGDKKECDK
ncbi:toxin co-regulated pilus biosynthesis Q family protein [Caballeronia sp. EK]|uniref:toxin co-regulated pilus biosynthesis Q family protein n=1 Tax=Caballeronia sp. EK TaxID=2767469 RepID=UPI001654FB05|nr:toxin co-regulated pilus biosynthesis Q family protein [Caballeronia sp. EK]MBC8641696.1 toxin co-regulated pilus biosynthesis Q family protein [Caballeronia sp. EK]